MKKRIEKILMWDHFCQVIFVMGGLPNLIFWARGHGSMFGMFMSGFNFGAAFYWELVIRERRRTDKWMNRAMNRKAPDVEIEKMLNIAEGLVEARFKSQGIDPDRN